jgi:hypothetical protein
MTDKRTFYEHCNRSYYRKTSLPKYIINSISMKNTNESKR